MKNFKDVQFEVRLDHREWEEIQNSEEFTQGDAEGKDGLAAETEEEKSERLDKESEAKVTQIEDKSEENSGMYSIYQMFMAASVLCAILGLVCIGYLIYLFVTDKNGEESQ